MKNIKTLQKWFKTHIKDQGHPYALDKNQAKIVLDTHKNALVTARAGSGKTRTVVAKITYLIAHEKIPPENIIVFAFNRKARAEINERLQKITYNNASLAPELPDVATTFHAFAYEVLGGKNALEDRIITEEQTDTFLAEILQNLSKIQIPKKSLEPLISQAKQFITRAEQQFFTDYNILSEKINDKNLPSETRETLKLFNQTLAKYHEKLANQSLLNFNQMVAIAAQKLKQAHYDYIFIDEYQDFSLLFLTLVKSLRQTCETAKLLAVGDDWQAINRFAGSNVEYFQHFEKYFPEDCKKLFIPTNYRSGKKIVKNANFFMGQALGDYNGCKSGNSLKSKIFLGDVTKINPPLENLPKNLPLAEIQYRTAVEKIIAANPNKSIKILSRNNNLTFRSLPLEDFCKPYYEQNQNITFSTIHRSKGLESDVVILLEIDAKKFPGPDKSGGLYEIFGDNAKTLLEDEHRLFYVALTRPKEKLYILTKTAHINSSDKKYNFLSYLNDAWLNELEFSDPLDPSF